MIEFELNDFQANLVVKALRDFKRKLEEDLSAIDSHNAVASSSDVMGEVGETAVTLLKSSIQETENVINILTS